MGLFDKVFGGWLHRRAQSSVQRPSSDRKSVAETLDADTAKPLAATAKPMPAAPIHRSITPALPVPEPPREQPVYIGLDFGTSTTKVIAQVWRATARQQQFVILPPNDASVSCLFPSTIALNRD